MGALWARLTGPIWLTGRVANSLRLADSDYATKEIARARSLRGVEKLLGVYTYAVSFPRAGRIDLPTYTLCNRRVTDVGCVSYMQS